MIFRPVAVETSIFDFLKHQPVSSGLKIMPWDFVYNAIFSMNPEPGKRMIKAFSLFL
jgi:hypothetical protein